GGLAVVDVAHRPHVDVGLGPIELLLRHSSCVPFPGGAPTPPSSRSTGPLPRAGPSLSDGAPAPPAPCRLLSSPRAVACSRAGPVCRRCWGVLLRYSPRTRATISREIEAGTSW